MSNKALIVGRGGREHALAWSVAQSEYVRHIECAPGNAGTMGIAANLNFAVETVEEVDALLDYNETHGNAFIIIGSENQLVLDVAGRARRRGQVAFGPDAYDARLETSKAYGIRAMKAYGVPSPWFYVATNPDEAFRFAESHDEYVVKADGPAGGKGVGLPRSRRHAKRIIDEMMVKRRFGESGDEVVFMGREEGPELSVIAICDGNNYVLLPIARDHKRFRNNGPNTGGIAAYAPVEDIPSEYMRIIREQFIERTLAGRAAIGRPYRGALYIGLMMTKNGPRAIEYNVRLGDPEFQAQALLLDEDFYLLLWQAARGELGQSRMAKTKKGAAAVITLAAPGYPDNPRTGQTIFGLDKVPDNVHVFHGGTRSLGDNRLVTDGGRALHIASHGETVAIAKEQIYKTIGRRGMHFAKMQYRKNM